MAERRQQRPRNNVYTVLVAAAFLVLVLSLVYVWMQLSTITGEMNPFQFGAAVTDWPAAAGLAELVQPAWTS